MSCPPQNAIYQVLSGHMDNQRTCGNCTACCHIAEVNEGIITKPACTACPFLDHGCKLFDQPERPQVCRDFQCSWLRGYGNSEDRPDKSGVMVSINNINGGTWIMVMDLVKNAHFTTGKHIIIDIATQVGLPVIIVDYDNLKEGRGDFVIINKMLKKRSVALMGKFIDYLDQEQHFEVYHLHMGHK